MNPEQLIVKCYAEQDGDCWVAVCLSFNLAAQGDSFEEVKTKLIRPVEGRRRAACWYGHSTPERYAADIGSVAIVARRVKCGRSRCFVELPKTDWVVSEDGRDVIGASRLRDRYT